jgi:hypothetical protein
MGSSDAHRNLSTKEWIAMSHVSVKKLAVIACLSICSLAAPPARAGKIVNQVIPISITVFVPCANGGAGEIVTLSGDLHDMFDLTFDNAGGVHIKIQDNPQGVSGVGETTGLKYQATGVTELELNAQIGIEETFVNNFRIIGQGPNNNFLVHENFHITINANGTLTSLIDNFSVECK